MDATANNKLSLSAKEFIPSEDTDNFKKMHAPTQMRQCRFFATERGCLNGSRCRFLHDTEESTYMGIHQNVRAGTKLCRFFNTPSGCRNGLKCSFRHERSSLVTESQRSCFVGFNTVEEVKPATEHGVQQQVVDRLDSMSLDNSSVTNDKIASSYDNIKNTGNTDSDDSSISSYSSDTDCSYTGTLKCSSCTWLLKEPVASRARCVMEEHFMKSFKDLDKAHIRVLEENAELCQKRRSSCRVCPKLTCESPYKLFLHYVERSQDGTKKSKQHNECLSLIAKLFVSWDINHAPKPVGNAELSDVGTSSKMVKCDHGEVKAEEEEHIEEIQTAGFREDVIDTELEREMWFHVLVSALIDSDCDSDTSLPDLEDISDTSCGGLEEMFYSAIIAAGLSGSYDDSDDDSYGLYGMGEDAVNELLCQGIKPWDPCAAAALSVIYGDDDDDYYY